MKANFVKKGIIIAALASVILIPVEQVVAAEVKSLTTAFKQEVNSEIDANALTNALAEVKKETNATEVIKIKSAEEMQFEKMFESKAFANVSGEYLLVNVTADENSDWTGKVFNMSVVEITGEENGFMAIQSGDVVGYVKAENLIIGKDAVATAKAALEAAFPEQDVYTLSEEQIFESFSVGETREAEEARLAAEEAARIAAEEARIAAEKAAKLQQGKDLISYAKQFIGNPYVYGGSSLTRGTDCSGYVKSVYAHYGIYLPRTSYSMRSVGTSVSYSDMQPGDIVCYSGHVALYAGDGMIVHAANEEDGITIDSVNYDRIITIRRMF
ncbi:MAG: C40 family peptidase [Tyzzerella sp.]|nr:C40 family peptidase [Tyzzerella sp.]